MALWATGAEVAVPDVEAFMQVAGENRFPRYPIFCCQWPLHPPPLAQIRVATPSRCRWSIWHRLLPHHSLHPPRLLFHRPFLGHTSSRCPRPTLSGKNPPQERNLMTQDCPIQAHHRTTKAIATATRHSQGALSLKRSANLSHPVPATHAIPWFPTAPRLPLQNLAVSQVPPLRRPAVPGGHSDPLSPARPPPPSPGPTRRG